MKIFFYMPSAMLKKIGETHVLESLRRSHPNRTVKSGVSNRNFRTFQTSGECLFLAFCGKRKRRVSGFQIKDLNRIRQDRKVRKSEVDRARIKLGILRATASRLGGIGVHARVNSVLSAYQNQVLGGRIGL